MFSNPTDDYLNQFIAEHKILVRNRRTGQAKEVWQKKKASIANHYLDSEVYATAGADIIRALNMRKDNIVKTHKPNREADAGWIKKLEGAWL